MKTHFLIVPISRQTIRWALPTPKPEGEGSAEYSAEYFCRRSFRSFTNFNYTQFTFTFNPL